MGNRFGAAKTVGWPGDVRLGILPPKKKEFSARGGGMRRSFAPKRALNRPMQPRLSDLPGGFAGDAALALPAGGRTWGVTDG